MSLDINEKCQVCDQPANGLHFGCITCRACSEFFRRSIIDKKRYECIKEGKCQMQKAMRYSCKHCRLKLCLDNGMKAECVQVMRKRPKNRNFLKLEDKNSIDYKDQTTDLILDQWFQQTQIFEMPPCPLKTIERMSNGLGNYKCQQKSLFTLLYPDNDPDKYQHVLYSDYIKMARGCTSLVFNTLHDYFPLFNELDLELKQSLMRTFSIHFSMFFQSYQTMLDYPEFDDSRFVLHCGQIITCDTVAHFHNFKKSVAIKHTEKIGDCCGRLVDKIRLLKVRQVEMAALIGIKMWNELSFLSKNLNKRADMERNQIYADLYSDIDYNYGVLKAGPRFGSLLMLLNDLDAITDLMVEIFTMAKIFDLFDVTIWDD